MTALTLLFLLLQIRKVEKLPIPLMEERKQNVNRMDKRDTIVFLQI